jgi:AcrR family transcriptional regulator
MDTANPTSHSLDASPRKRSARKTEKLEQLIDAAFVVFGERGYHSASIHDICLRAGVSIGTFYAHFDDKKDLIARVMRERSRPFLTSVTPADLRDLDALVARMALVLANPGTMAFWRAWREAALDERGLAGDEAEIRLEVRHQVTATIREAREGRPIVLGKLDPDIAAWAIMAVVREFAMSERAESPTLEMTGRIIRDLALGPCA